MPILQANVNERAMRYTLALTAALSVVTGIASAFSGQPLVADGDTFMVGSQRVRLWGVDAPEGHQNCQDGAGRSYACGDEARAELVRLIGSRIVTCEARDIDPYGRTVGQCRVGDVDLGREMVSRGWAVDYTQFSHGAYAEAQADARANRRGIWSGTFQRPSDWRAQARASTTAAAPSYQSTAPAPSGCAIKGNISSAGARIYHVPGQMDYEATQINPNRGERWFCSPAEAQAAGWRPARR